MTGNGCESSIANKTGKHSNVVLLQHQSLPTTIAEIGRLLKPVSEALTVCPAQGWFLGIRLLVLAFLVGDFVGHRVASDVASDGIR
jgi:hypothetical protein